MTHEEIVQQRKNQALNEIRKIYNPKYKFPYDDYYANEESRAEQREGEVKSIIERLEEDLKILKFKKRFVNLK